MSVDRVNLHPSPAGRGADWFANPVFDIYDVAPVTQDDGAFPSSPSGHLARIDVPSTDKGLAITSYSWVPLEAGVAYVITAWGWSPEGSPDFTVDVPFFAAPGEWSTVKGALTSASCAFTPTVTQDYAPALRFGATGGGQFFYAGMTVERADTPAVGATYFDGNTPGASWDGEPGESVSRLPVLSQFDVTTPPRTLDEVLAGSGPRLTRVDIITGPRAGETLPVVDGSITVDLAADVRRTGSLTVPGTDEWTPDGPTHTLDVRSRSELQVWQGVVGDDGVEHWWSQGVFLVAGSSVSDSAGGGRDVSVDLVDRSHRIKRAGIRRRWSADGTAYILASIAAVLAEVAPWATLDIDLTADITFDTDAVIAEWGDDVWVRCRALARTMSRDLHVNRDGVVVATPIVDPLEAAPVPMLGMVARSLQVDAEDIVNVTGCAWEEARPDDAAENWQPKGGVVEWVDNQSSTSVAAYGVCTDSAGGDTSVVHTAAHAALAAQAHGITRLGLQQAASGSKVPDPRDDVGVPVDVDGTTHIVSRLGIDLAGRSATSVDMGASRPDIALMMAGLTKPAGEYRTTEIVTGLSPLRARSVTDPGGSEVSVQWTDALAGVEVGDPITVSHKGAGLRVGVALLVKKPLSKKAAGEKAFSLAGGDVDVNDSVSIRARVGSTGTYGTGTMSGGTVSMTLPEPDTALNWSYSSASIPAVIDESVHAAVDMYARRKINDLLAVVSYINGRLVNLDANN